jgi:hypothetical protein
VGVVNGSSAQGKDPCMMAGHHHTWVFASFAYMARPLLAHSPPLPLIIDYFEEDRDIAAEDEEGIM